MTVQVLIRQMSQMPREVELKNKAEAILGHVGLGLCELSLLCTNDAEMAELNYEYRGMKGTTDVLSFPQVEGRPDGLEGEVLGDVVISMEAAKRQANVAGHSVEKEIDILLTHGILHLAGYDHEQGLEESRRMKTLEEKIKKLLDLESKE